MSYYDYDSDRYNYKEICEKALASDATQEDINALGEWFERYGRSGWNGECWTVDAYHDLYPIHKEVGYDDYEVVGYTFSSRDEDRFIMRPMTEEERAEEEAREMAELAKDREEERLRREEAHKAACALTIEELTDKYGCRLAHNYQNGEPTTYVRVVNSEKAYHDMAMGRIRRHKKEIKQILLARRAEKERRQEEAQKAREEQENAVPGLEELREAVDEYNEAFNDCYFGDRPMCTLDAEEKKLYALAAENRRAAAYIYTNDYARSFDRNSGEKAMAAISEGKDIKSALRQMWGEGGTRVTYLLFNGLFEDIFTAAWEAYRGNSHG